MTPKLATALGALLAAALFGWATAVVAPSTFWVFSIYARIAIVLSALFLAPFLSLPAVRASKLPSPSRLLSVLGAVFVLICIAVPLNKRAFDRAIASAKEFPAKAAPYLEAYREKKGRYPASLADIPNLPRVPRLYHPNSYGALENGATYQFFFEGKPKEIWTYDRSSGKWSSIDADATPSPSPSAGATSAPTGRKGSYPPEGRSR